MQFSTLILLFPLPGTKNWTCLWSDRSQVRALSAARVLPIRNLFGNGTDERQFWGSWWTEEHCSRLRNSSLIIGSPGLLLPVSQAMYNAGRAVELVKSLGKLGEPDTNMFSTFLARVLHTDCLPVAPVVSEEKSVDFFTGGSTTHNTNITHVHITHTHCTHNTQT